MKLATLKDGTRDGQLIVVSRDLRTAVVADGVARSLQRAMDDWAFVSPQLDKLYRQLNDGKVRRSFDFESRDCMAPLPRAYQLVRGSAYVNHVELVCRTRGVEMPSAIREDTLLYQGCSDNFIGPRDDIELKHERQGIDFESAIAVIIDDVPMGYTSDQAYQQIRLLVLVNEISLRNLIPEEFAMGGGLVQSKPVSSFSPVVVTPDELGDAWKDAKVHLPLRSTLNGKLVGQPNAGVDMVFNFARLISHLVKTRSACAGTIVSSGAVSNKDAKMGYSSIFEKRSLEAIAGGNPATSYMSFGDNITIEMLDSEGRTIFGAIEQTVHQFGRPKIAPADTSSDDFGR